MNNIELLAPAGDLERLKIALLYGADAVYIGGKNFSLRANALNFSIPEIKEAVLFAHNLHKKVYVTVNIVFHDEDITGLKEYLNELANIHVDSVIVSDPTVIDLINKNNINLEIHMSTQASTLNAEAVKFWQQENVKRFVLAREASKEDITDIKNITHTDVECFIHGAMCTSFSGRCVLSNYATNRDSNRGGCAQICRWTFDCGEKEPFSMTPKDLNMVENIKSMINIGVNSFKIEGRMRSIYYIATVVWVYRNIIDKVINNTITEEETAYYLKLLNRCANRDSTSQFYDKLPGKEEQYFLGRDEISNQDFLGLVKSYDKENNIVTIEERNFFKIGDTVEFFGPNKKVYTYNILNIYDENMFEIEYANHPQMIIKLRCNLPLEEFDMMRIKVFDNLDNL